jgi:hypothetical protein
MNQLLKEIRGDAVLEPLDALLADVAIRIQRSATDYGKAQSRNRVINDHLEREGRPAAWACELAVPSGVDGGWCYHRVSAAHR